MPWRHVGGGKGIAPPFLTSALDGEWLASRLGLFTPEERAPSTNWIGGRVGSRADLDAMGKIQIAPAGNRNLIVQPVQLPLQLKVERKLNEKETENTESLKKKYEKDYNSISSKEIWGFGRAIAQAVGSRIPTAAARFDSRSCGICGGQSSTGAGFLRLLRFRLSILIPPTTPHSSPIIWGWYNRLNSGRRTKWTQSHRTPRN
jgi:hypothetical protein